MQQVKVFQTHRADRIQAGGCDYSILSHKRKQGMRIISPMPTGCGAYISHCALQRNIPGYRVWRYHPRMRFLPFLLPYMFSRAARHADCIHTTPDLAMFLAPGHIPLVTTFRNYVLDSYMKEYSSAGQRLYYATALRMFTRRAVARADAVTAVSGATAKLVREDLGFCDDVEIIPNAVDEQKFFPSEPARNPHNEKTVRVLFSGNRTCRKGAHLLDPIAQRLAPRIELLVTGGLRKERLEAGTRVSDLGCIPVDQMPQLYREVDMLLLPTVREGLCRAALEAMACGLAVVTTNVSSMPELIHHEKGGFLCDPEDVDQFVAAIVTLADNPQLRASMGAYNRKRIVTEFAFSKMIDSYTALFERVIRAKAP